MFFVLSKIIGFLIEPVSIIALAALLAMVAGLAGRRRAAATFAFLAFLVTALGGWTRAGGLLLERLEDRFPYPAGQPARIDGIIVLGGGFEGAVNLVRGGTELSAAGDRFVEAAALALAHPEARIVVTGGVGALVTAGETDAATATRFFTRFGIAPDRLLLEGESRNTDENARYVAAMIDRKPGETWLLVTSAFHMPRSVGLFRKAGLDILPWPADYRTPGPGGGWFGGNPASNIDDLTRALREWTGLAAYWITGRIDSPFPAP